MASFANARIIWRGPKPPVPDEIVHEIMQALLVPSISMYPTAAGFLMRLKPVTDATPALGPNDLIIQMPGLDLTRILVNGLCKERRALILFKKQC